MRHLILLLATGLSLVLIPAILPGQTLKIPTDTTQLVSVSTVDGNEFVGQILKIEAEAIVLKTENLGALRLRKQDIKTIKPVSRKQFVGGEYWFENPHSTRYFFGPNGYGLRKGEGYYQNTWIFFNQVNYGITDNFSMGVGIMPLFLIGGEASPVWVTPKVSLPVKKDKVNLGFGGIFYYLLGGDGETLGIAYGQATFGSRDKNVNIGVGYGVADGEWASAPTLSLSGFYRVGKKFALMTENYFIGAGETDYLLMSFGGRFIGKKIAIDAGLIVPTETGGEFFSWPWLGISVPFGRGI